MIERDAGLNSFQKKITPYLDGALSPEEASEFEAFVLTHPEFEAQIRTKKEEVDLIRSMIPVAMITREASESIEGEMRTSIFNLLKEEPGNIWDLIRIKWEEWTNR